MKFPESRFNIQINVDFYLTVFFYTAVIKILLISILGLNLHKFDYSVYRQTYSNKNIHQSEVLKKNEIPVENNVNLASIIGDDINKAVKFNVEENIPDGVELIEYRVKPGDSIWLISRKHQISPAEFLKFNNLKTEVLYKNQIVKIPDYSGRVELPAHEINLLWPVNGWVSSGFGKRVHPITGRYDFHDGIDIVSDPDAPIRASETGIVIFSDNRRFAGNTIVIRHIDGFSSIYAHCSQLLVEKGDYVAKGDIIGRIGKTGLATGYHVHFAVKLYGTYVNPIKYLRQYIID
ncbi:MAG: peptidoglycan DD-metalloendopeptidase family protein [Candidatus Muiribacteriota bacterium]